MAITRQDLEGFFTEYGRALGSRDAKSIATHWGIPGLVMSDAGAVPVASAGDVEAFFSAAMPQYDGVAEAKATIVHVAWLSANVVAVEIQWQHKDERGNTVGGESGHYMLGKQSDRLSIHVYAPKTA